MSRSTGLKGYLQRENTRFRDCISLRTPYAAKFDDLMTDGCQGTKDFLA